MKIISSYIVNDISHLIRNVVESEHISFENKRVIINILEQDYSKILSSPEDGVVKLSKSKINILENPLLTPAEKIAVNNILFRNLKNVTEFDNRNTILNIDEAVKENKGKIKDRLPVFFIFNGGKNVVSSAIMFFTQGDFSHVSISTNGLNEIISFATTEQNHGLVVENYYDFVRIRKPKVIGVYASLVTLADYEKIKDSIEYYKANTNKYGYSWKKFFLFPFKSKQVTGVNKDTTELICSEYVTYLVSNTELAEDIQKNGGELKPLMTPTAVRDNISLVSQQLYEGMEENFNEKVITEFYDLFHADVLQKKKHIDDKAVKKHSKNKLGIGKRVKDLMPADLNIKK